MEPRPLLTSLAAVPALGLCLAGCLGRTIAHPGALTAHDVPEAALAELPPEFRGLIGFDELVAVDAEDGLQMGDQVLYRAYLHEARGTREWFVRMELGAADGRRGEFRLTPTGGPKETFTSPLWTVEVEVLDLDSGERVITEMWIAESSMRHSLFGASRTYASLEAAGLTLDSLPDEERRAYILGTLSIANLFNGWQQNEQLRPLLEAVIGFPTRALLGALFAGSLSYQVRQETLDDSAARVALPSPVGALDAERIPLEIRMGGTTLMHVDLVVVETSAPLSVGFGAVTLRGAHPTDPERWVQIDLVGARRAPRSGR